MKLKKIGFLFLILVVSLILFLVLTLNTKKKTVLSQTSDINNQQQNLNYEHPLIPVVLRVSSIPNLSAESFILIDNDTNTVLLSKNPNVKIYPASTTKLATALTALNIYPLDEVITIPQEYKEGKVMGLKFGEKITVRSLISALLIYSANDSAFNLAFHHPDGVEGFVKEMNLIAQKYNLKDTNFTNFDGIHDPNHYSTAYDLSQFGRIAIKNPIIRDIVKTKKIVVTDIDNHIQHNLESTNELLDVVPEIEGLKTGWTPEASGCFVGLININGHKLISVVAQSSDRFSDTRQIINWAKENIEWKEYSI